jgi:hypothetical protein
MHARYSPLAQQFADPEEIFVELRELTFLRQKGHRVKRLKARPGRE